MSIGFLIILVISAACAATGQILFKYGATGRNELLDFINLAILSGLAFYGVGTCLWIYALSRQKLITVYPFTVLAFVFVYIWGITFLEERPGRFGLSGVALILVGLYLISAEGDVRP